ncbi:hypothetical protein ACS0TY_033339 [Phlomoides rotata]
MELHLIFVFTSCSISVAVAEYCRGRNDACLQTHLTSIQKHAKARNCIERSFGILKARWGILRSNSFYPIKTQNRFILGCCMLHNFIRAHMAVDPYEADVPESFADVHDGNENADGFIDQVESSQAWTSWRDNLAIQMFADYMHSFVITYD